MAMVITDFDHLQSHTLEFEDSVFLTIKGKMRLKTEEGVILTPKRIEEEFIMGESITHYSKDAGKTWLPIEDAFGK